MSKIIWESPAPSSGFLRGVNVDLRPRREIALSFEYEDSSYAVVSCELIFLDVAHYRSTYMYALRADIIRESYDKVIDVGQSPVLEEVVSALLTNQVYSNLIHYRVCFDDGPCFDFVAGGFRVFYNSII